jgi:hypothetical protein
MFVAVRAGGNPHALLVWFIACFIANLLKLSAFFRKRSGACR